MARLVCSLALVLGLFGVVKAETRRPNILWITAEDASPALGCYGDEYATTPHIDALAKESVRYTHAFATAPVCSPSRSCLITGCYAPSLGTHNMRSAFPLPNFVHGFPKYLRDAGYYTTNNVKTDYNTSSWERLVEESWNESSDKAHWRKREETGRPFFSIFNLMTSHQSRSMVWPRERFEAEVQSKLDPDEIHDPSMANLPPYYPDTATTRRTWARFYDCMTVMDKEVGTILAQLEEDGLADDTIVFFYSDHGTGLPRHKRCLLDSGMHVPLLVRFPEKYRHLAPAKSGETTDRLVSFVDFAPTVLSIAGVEIPEYVQGTAFLGETAGELREYVFGHRDRVDEAFDMARSVRSGRYLYIRNYRPDLGWNQPTAWPGLGEVRGEFAFVDPARALRSQWHFVAPTRHYAELYDCVDDPHNQLNMMLSRKSYHEIYEPMKAALEEHIRETRDVGFLPESYAATTFEGTTQWEAARSGDLGLAAAREATADVGSIDDKRHVEHLKSDEPPVRYWGAVGLASMHHWRPTTAEAVRRSLNDEVPAVRIAVANAVARKDDPQHALPVLIDALESDDLNVVLQAARTIELLGRDAVAAVPAMKKVAERAERIRPADTPATFVLSGEQDLAMFIGFAAHAFLDDVENGDWIDLFDGESLDGWEARAKGDVSVVDGEIRILSKGANLWLVHEGEFDDFELVAEVRMPKEGGYNSGIGFRCTGKGKPKGYQCEVEEAKSGMIYAIGSGWVWPKGADESKRFKEMAGDAFRTGEWNHFRIRCEGKRIQIRVNGTLTADVEDDRFAKGSIALQHHGKGDVHRFRNIRIRPLKTKAE